MITDPEFESGPGGRVPFVPNLPDEGEDEEKQFVPGSVVPWEESGFADIGRGVSRATSGFNFPGVLGTGIGALLGGPLGGLVGGMGGRFLGMGNPFTVYREPVRETSSATSSGVFRPNPPQLLVDEARQTAEAGYRPGAVQVQPLPDLPGFLGPVYEGTRKKSAGAGQRSGSVRLR